MKEKKSLIYLITDGTLDSQNYALKSLQTIALIKIAVQAEIPIIQIREKNLPARLLFQLTSEIVKISKKSATKILVNDRADVALAAKADGVHLTSTSIPTKIIRQNFRQDFIIGVSTHTSEKALQAKQDGANFAVFSPIFYTPNKGKPQGIEKLSEVVKTAKDFPIIALGGINEANFAETLRAGASGIAAIRLLNEAEKLTEIVKKINGEFDD
ncbi:MAG: thiamine phosphate synthase [Blastocatellia bacterium]|nr:thiamine phosphate synthase [Blastocatellia bacterium]